MVVWGGGMWVGCGGGWVFFIFVVWGVLGGLGVVFSLFFCCVVGGGVVLCGVFGVVCELDGGV